ncbi:hypothetical protein DFH09DRAFT_1367788 [Mycena vulgaris]|nr:hypothetical protein DFH09DRAFT_1367788 [Mycena vulgaris]
MQLKATPSKKLKQKKRFGWKKFAFGAGLLLTLVWMFVPEESEKRTVLASGSGEVPLRAQRGLVAGSLRESVNVGVGSVESLPQWPSGGRCATCRSGLQDDGHSSFASHPAEAAALLHVLVDEAMRVGSSPSPSSRRVPLHTTRERGGRGGGRGRRVFAWVRASYLLDPVCADTRGSTSPLHEDEHKRALDLGEEARVLSALIPRHGAKKVAMDRMASTRACGWWGFHVLAKDAVCIVRPCAFSDVIPSRAGRGVAERRGACATAQLLSRVALLVAAPERKKELLEATVNGVAELGRTPVVVKVLEDSRSGVSISPSWAGYGLDGDREVMLGRTSRARSSGGV